MSSTLILLNACWICPVQMYSIVNHGKSKVNCVSLAVIAISFNPCPAASCLCHDFCKQGLRCSVTHIFFGYLSMFYASFCRNLCRNNFAELPELSQVFIGWLPKSLGVLDLSGLNIGGLLPVNWSTSPDLLSLEKL